jgi:hypothetical protein
MKKAARKRKSQGTILAVDVGGSHVKVMTDKRRTKSASFRLDRAFPPRR